VSFRLADLKKSVRKGREGYQVTPARLEGRPAAFRIEFLLQQFEGHLGSPRRMLDPDSLLDFVGDARLGRGLLATLAQWYRMRPRTFAEVLEDGGERLLGHGIAGPVDLRAFLYAAANQGHHGFLGPEDASLFWQGQARTLGIRSCRGEPGVRPGRTVPPGRTPGSPLQQLMLLDRSEEAILVRTGPAPRAADVMAAYNARAHTTLLRSATEVALRCDAPRGLLDRAARIWAAPLDVAWRVEADTLRLFGRPDALGCWTRHGRRVERAALELLALPELATRELLGRIEIKEKSCRFLWKGDILTLLGVGQGARLAAALPEQVTALAAALRRERDRQVRAALGSPPSALGPEKAGPLLPAESREPRAESRSAATWSIRQAAHLVGVEGGVCLPHLELRHGDLSLYLRLVGPEPGGETASLGPFHGKTPLVGVAWSGEESGLLSLQFPGETPQDCVAGELLPALAARLEQMRETVPAPREARRAMKTAA
jgi:hypothetical protein